jgi:hypothetical protein
VTYSLDVVDGSAAGVRLEIPNSGLLVGRSARPPGHLGGDPALSRQHARFTPSPDGALLVEDLGSTNGTRVNGTTIRGPFVAHSGDVVQVGETTLRIFGEDAATTRSHPAFEARSAAGSTAVRGEDAESEAHLREALYAWLSQDREGRELLSRLDHDAAGTAEPLADWIAQRRRHAPAPLATYVTGGHVDRLVNIANARDVHIHEPPKQLWDKVANARGGAFLFLMLGIAAVVGGIASFGYVVVSFIATVWSSLGSNSTAPPKFTVHFVPWAPLGLGLEVAGLVIITLAVGASARESRRGR